MIVQFRQLCKRVEGRKEVSKHVINTADMQLFVVRKILSCNTHDTTGVFYDEDDVGSGAAFEVVMGFKRTQASNKFPAHNVIRLILRSRFWPNSSVGLHHSL